MTGNKLRELVEQVKSLSADEQSEFFRQTLPILWALEDRPLVAMGPPVFGVSRQFGDYDDCG